jgi:hypothetical protein
VHIFAIDPQTQLLTETASSPLPGFTSVPALMLDPTGPFMYQSDATGTSVQAFQIDPLTGYFTAVAGTTISAPGVNSSYVFGIVPGQQNLVGPQASLTPAALSLGNITIGTVSPAQPIVLTSTGDQALSLTSISIGGANGVLVVMVTCAAASLGGCGGGSSGVLVTPPPVITPAGTSTIVITPTAMSATGQPLQLPPIQLTLTVN